MALYQSGKRISGIRDFPAYTWAEYHALPAAQRPKVWKCTDRDYTDVLASLEGSESGSYITVTQNQTQAYTSVISTVYTEAESLKLRHFYFHTSGGTSLYRFFSIRVNGAVKFNSGTGGTVGAHPTDVNITLLLKQGDVVELLTQTPNTSNTTVTVYAS